MLFDWPLGQYQFHKKKEIICNTFWELPVSLLRPKMQIVIVLSSFFDYFTQSYSQMITCADKNYCVMV